MIRSVWLAFIFLACLCGLAAFKTGIATPSAQQAAIEADVIEVELSQTLLPKADRLDDTSEPRAVQAIAIVPPATAAAQPQEKPTKFVSRHWRDSYAKVKKRKHFRHHAIRTKKLRRAHR